MAKSAYVHIPFCSHKCDFCDFTAFAGLEHMVEIYVQTVCREIEDRQLKEANELPLQSVFYGGGTPGLIEPHYIAAIHKTLEATVGLDSAAEITLETTPQAITQEKAAQWIELGINRLSIGVQSLQDKELNAMGRGHGRRQALDGIQAAKAAGFSNISCDLMYGLPEQTLQSWTQTLDEVISQSLPHLSAYALGLAVNSPLLERYPSNSAAFPNEDCFAAMYETLVAITSTSGLRQYEISNFSWPGYESKHNFSYWSNEEYLAFGVGAHRYVNGCRSSNWRSLNRYLRDWLGSETEEALSPEIQRKEALFLGLRTRKGLDLRQFKQKWGLDIEAAFAQPIARLLDGGFLERQEGRLLLSQKGVLVSNSVMAEFM